MSVEDVETFMLKHGECIVDIMGGEIDRIEKNLKVNSNGSLWLQFEMNFQSFFVHNQLLM